MSETYKQPWTTWPSASFDVVIALAKASEHISPESLGLEQYEQIPYQPGMFKATMSGTDLLILDARDEVDEIVPDGEVTALDMAGYDVVIENDADWAVLAKRGFETVIDPMVFRSAEMWLQGEEIATQRLERDGGQVWSALRENIGSLVAFFDALVLSDHLPIFDYGLTFDDAIGYEVQPLRDMVNAAAGTGLIEAVHVMGNAASDARAAAIASLAGASAASAGRRKDILDQLSIFDHKWEPNVDALHPQSAEDKRLLQFAYGGRLFSEYASRAQIAHLLQPSRSRLFLDLAIGGDVHDEDALFDVLRSRLAEHRQEDAVIVDLGGLPSFLPYLLAAEPASPAELLDNALALRSEGRVADYRAWRSSLLSGWRERGHIDHEVERDLRKTARQVAREFEPRNMPKVEVKLTLAGVTGGVALPLQRLFGWASGKLPGRRHTMLLMRMAVAQHEYDTLDKHLHRLWKT